MPRKRQLDPEFFSDEEIARLSPLARLFYQGTWCYCEDTAVFKARFNTLKTQILPYDEVNTENLYKELKQQKFIIEFINNGEVFAFIKGFHKRQIIQHPSRSILPLPPEPFLSKIPEKIRKLNESSMSPQSKLNEEYNRVELSRVELSRVEKEQQPKKEPSAALRDKLAKVYQSGFNIYSLINTFIKKSKINTQIPEVVLISVCDYYIIKKSIVKKSWPYFYKVLVKKSEEYCANQQIEAHKEFKRIDALGSRGGISTAGSILKQIFEKINERKS